MGQAIIEDITSPVDVKQRFLIALPTMRVPIELAGTVNVYLAFRGLLSEVLMLD